jgi:transposase
MFEDESGLNLFPNVYKTWAEIGQTPVLIEPPRRLHHSAIGWIVATAGLSRLRFLFTMFSGSVVTEDLIFFLTALHFHYRHKIVLVWDNIGFHKSVEEHFQLRHPDWFDFVSFPTYAPELNPVEQCWKEMKGGDLSNFTAEDTETLTTAAVESAQKISKNATLIRSFFKHAGLSI